MAARTEIVVQQIDDLLARAGFASGGPGPAVENLPLEGRAALATAWGAGVARLAPRASDYRGQVTRSLERYEAAHPNHLKNLIGVLRALRADYEAGYMTSVEELIHADVFGDLLGMAGELLGKGYKDACAVLTGSVLEEHIRKLCNRYAVAVESADGAPRKADTLNAELVKANAYSKLDQKSVTAWLGLRNDAAHGHYDRYTHEQVGLLLEGVRNFLTRHPA